MGGPAEPNTPPAPAPVDAAPTWRRQPYRVFFTLGLLHLWAGLTPWLLTALGMRGHHTQVYHSIAQIQGFMVCFALGFLFTMIPRRTRTAAPHPVEMVIGAACPILTTVCAGLEMLAVSQLFWFVLVGLLTQFILRRVRAAATPSAALPAFVWLPIGLSMGLVGSILFGVYGSLGTEAFRVHELAQLFLLQGVFLSLVVGVGSMVFPLFTRGLGPGDRAPAPAWSRRVHVAAAAVLVGTFFLQVYGAFDLGHFARGLLCAVLLVWAGEIHRPPSLPGANRLLVWIAAWMIPLGYVAAGLLPREQFQAGLHLVFVGGFATMAFAVAAHVALAHGDRKPVLAGWPWQIVGYGGLFLVALAARVVMPFDTDPSRYNLWLGTAAGAFLLGSLCWAALVLPHLLGRAHAEAG